MGWGVINEEERLLPVGENHELKIEAGKTYKFRLLLQPGEEPYSFFEHILENERVENGQTTRLFRTINCPKCQSNPYAPCKLCDGQQARRRVRHVANIYDYESSTVKILKGGESVWKPIGTLVKMGVDITTLDFAVTRTGNGRNDTTYSVVNLGPSQSQLPEGLELYNMVEEYKPHTEEEQKSIVEAIGLNWNALIIPPPIQYPNTLTEALNHEIPNTKYKGQTMKQVWDTNKGMIEFFAKSNRVTPEKAYAQVILVNLGGADIPGVPKYNAQGTAPNISGNAPSTPQGQKPSNNAQTQGNANGAQENTSAKAPVSNERQAKIDQINKNLQTNEKFKQGGYQAIMSAMKEASGGKTSINEFTDIELDKMLEISK